LELVFRATLEAGLPTLTAIGLLEVCALFWNDQRVDEWIYSMCQVRRPQSCQDYVRPNQRTDLPTLSSGGEPYVPVGREPLGEC